MNEVATIYLDHTGSTTIALYNTLFTRVIEREEAENTFARQTVEIAMLENSGSEFREAAQKTLSRQKVKLEATRRAISVYDLSANIVAGAILQIAKQGIAIRWGLKRENCPVQGRTIGGTCVRDLIWHGRNQAMHYEHTEVPNEQSSKASSWVDLFLSLDEGHPGVFSLKPPYESRAKGIFDLLGWQQYSLYESDMRDLIRIIPPHTN